MHPLLDFLDDLGDEGVDVTGVARGDDALVGHHLLIDPTAARIDDIGADGNVRGDVAVLDRPGLNQQPGRVADGGDDLAAIRRRL